jgi:hypothetical protein
VEMTLDQALEAFKAEFPGWWWRCGECHVSCHVTIGPDYGHCPDGDLLRYRTFDEGFDAELLQPSTIVQALLATMEKARAARREFRARSAAALAMETRAIEAVASGRGIPSPENWIKAEIAKRCEGLKSDAGRS